MVKFGKNTFDGSISQGSWQGSSSLSLPLKLMKHPYDDDDENVNEELCVAKSFSLKRNLIASANRSIG